MGTAKKILLSILSGTAILIISWKYQNYDYSLSVEDGFIKKMFWAKDYIYSAPSRAAANFVFINTGKDLALIEDTMDYGVVAVSDREKLYRFLSELDNYPGKALFNVIDLQFYYPYSKEPLMDSLLNSLVAGRQNILIPILKSSNGEYRQPLYNAQYAYSDYRTFGSSFNKFRLMNQERISSIPVRLHEYITKSTYKDHWFFPTCDGRLCLSALWPNYYLRNSDINGLNYETELGNIAQDQPRRSKGNVSAEYYNIGELLFDMDADRAKYARFFDDKIVIIGNFQEDMHSTPVGKMAGPVLLANIFLSLLNGQHIVSYWMIGFLLAAFSGLSYIAWFRRMPELKFRFRFLFSSYLVKFIRGYVSYFGCMFLLSILVLWLFNVQVALFLPSLIFTTIEYIRLKKYKDPPLPKAVPST